MVMPFIHPYATMKPGSYIKYVVFKITGMAHPSGVLDIASREQYAVNGVQYIHCEAFPSPQPVVWMITRNESQPIPTFENVMSFYYPNGNCLLNGAWDCDTGLSGVGEANSQQPFQILLSKNPVVGESHDLSSEIFYFDAQGKRQPHDVFHHKYKTLYQGPWGVFPDTYRTVSIENYNLPNGHGPINYVWQRGKSWAVNYWKSDVHLNLVDVPVPYSGSEWYAVEFGGQ